MAIHLLVIAEDEPFLDPFKSAKKRAIEIDKVFLVRTCKSPAELLPVVRNAVLQTAQRIGKLDIFGHGSPGNQYLGSSVLFGAENGVLVRGKESAYELRRFLTADAHIRLLGCMTATGENGRALLLSLREELGQSVVVYGTIIPVDACAKPPAGGMDASEFDERGFKPLKEEDWLFSSTEAPHKLAPTQQERIRENQAWFTGIKAG